MKRGAATRFPGAVGARSTAPAGLSSARAFSRRASLDPIMLGGDRRDRRLAVRSQVYSARTPGL
jgi:hypothetical protein